MIELNSDKKLEEKNDLPEDRFSMKISVFSVFFSEQLLREFLIS
jgi:hypothetical protein